MAVKKTDADEIILRAMELFRKQGYRATTMDSIGQACHLKKGSLYHYFSSKEALMEAILNRLSEDFRQNIFSIADTEEISAFDRLEKMLKVTEQYFLTREGGCLMGRVAMKAIGSAQIRGIVKQFFTSWTRSLTTIFETKYSNEVARTMAELAVKEIQGAIILQSVYQSGDPVTTTMDRVKQSFVGR